MRTLLTISLLFVLLYQISEPLLVSLRFARAIEAPVAQVGSNDDQIEIKMYAPLPYTGNWEDSDPVQKCFKMGDDFYNMVERRYENDTLYFTLQRNLNARDKFFALSNILRTLQSDPMQQQDRQAPAHASAEDFMKVFSPALPPLIVRNAGDLNSDRGSGTWHYAFYLPTSELSVTVPPPDAVSL